MVSLTSYISLKTFKSKFDLSGMLDKSKNPEALLSLSSLVDWVLQRFNEHRKVESEFNGITIQESLLCGHPTIDSLQYSLQ